MSHRPSSSWRACPAGPRSAAGRCSSERGWGGPVLPSLAATPGGSRPVNPVLAAGMLIVSVALTLSILLQSRGSGLGGTFGGDSAVYRSRRGIERRLWQFTIVLIVLFVLFSLSAYIFSPTVV